MRNTVERWAATSAVLVGAVALGVALYSKSGEAQAPAPAPAAARASAPVARQAALPLRQRHPRQHRPDASTRATIDFDKQVKPILEEYCLECHSADKRKGGLSLAAYTDVLDGGRSGAVVRPGHAASQPAAGAGEGRSRPIRCR